MLTTRRFCPPIPACHSTQAIIVCIGQPPVRDNPISQVDDAKSTYPLYDLPVTKLNEPATHQEHQPHYLDMTGLNCKPSSSRYTSVLSRQPQQIGSSRNGHFEHIPGLIEASFRRPPIVPQNDDLHPSPFPPMYAELAPSKPAPSTPIWQGSWPHFEIERMISEESDPEVLERLRSMATRLATSDLVETQAKICKEFVLFKCGLYRNRRISDNPLIGVQNAIIEYPDTNRYLILSKPIRDIFTFRKFSDSEVCSKLSCLPKAFTELTEGERERWSSKIKFAWFKYYERVSLRENERMRIPGTFYDCIETAMRKNDNTYNKKAVDDFLMEYGHEYHVQNVSKMKYLDEVVRMKLPHSTKIQIALSLVSNFMTLNEAGFQYRSFTPASVLCSLDPPGVLLTWKSNMLHIDSPGDPLRPVNKGDHYRYAPENHKNSQYDAFGVVKYVAELFGIDFIDHPSFDDTKGLLEAHRVLGTERCQCSRALKSLLTQALKISYRHTEPYHHFKNPRTGAEEVEIAVTLKAVYDGLQQEAAFSEPRGLFSKKPKLQKISRFCDGSYAETYRADGELGAIHNVGYVECRDY